MNFDLSMNLTQEQKLILTQKMQLSIKILQMSTYELEKYINEQLQENPVIEGEVKNPEMTQEEYEKFIKYLDRDRQSNSEAISQYEDEKVSPLSFVSKEKSLTDILEQQIGVLEISKTLKKACLYIIENIDDRGYFDGDIKEVAEEVSISYEKGEEALKIVQDLDPIGVGARNLNECLKIQLEKRGIQEENLFKIVDEYLELIAENKYADIAKKLKVSSKEAQDYGDIIKSLEPKPSRGYYTGEDVKFIIPDAYIEIIDDECVVIMNDSYIPELKVNDLYKNILVSKEATEEEKKYVKEKFDSAMFLIKSVYQRKSTLYNVINEILTIQDEYFKKGRKYLRPMTMKEISERLEVHESTVSRAIREKYIATSDGTIKIKDLFTTGISNSGEEEVSVIKIKDELRKLIDQEEKSKPLSDQKLSEILNEKDMNISRRTVAKYREELGIKSSSKRKRF